MASSELPMACWLWWPLATGAVTWPWLGPLLTIAAVLGGWWRVICLRQALRGSPWVGASLLPRCWALIAFAWSSLGLAVGVGLILLSLRMQPGVSTSTLLQTWRIAAVAEVLVAILWVLREASVRQSRWVALMMAAAGGLVAICTSLQWLAATRPEAVADSRLVAVAAFAMLLLGGSVAVVLIADGAGRVLASETDEAFDRQSS
jgi:hypothetical protein